MNNAGKVLMNTYLRETRHLLRDALQITLTLFKILIPVLIIVRVLEQLGVIEVLANIATPLMHLVGLPGEAALPWMTTMATGIYPGMAVFFGSGLADQVSVAQASVLGGMMLINHGLPVEGSIARRVGVTWPVTLLLRVVGGFAYGALLNHTYRTLDWLQTPNQALMPVSNETLAWPAWIQAQVINLWWIFAVITALVVILRLLRLLGIEKLIAWLLTPLLRLLGIGKAATNITLIGITLGLSYGGGLLIREADSGALGKQDIFASMCLINLLHSLIEDTLLVMLMGTDLSAALYGRLLFSFVVIALLARTAAHLPPAIFDRWLLRRKPAA